MSDNDLIRIQRDLAIALNGESCLQTALAMCLETALAISGMDGGGIYLRADDGGLESASSQGLSDQFIAAVARYGPETDQVNLVQQGKPVYMRISDLSDRIQEPCGLDGLKSLAVIPIRHLGEVIACVNLASRTHSEIPVAVRHQIESIAASLGGAIARLRAEAACRQGKDMLDALLDATTESAYLLDTEGRFVVANQTMAERLGTTVADIIGKRIADFVSRQVNARGIAHCESVMRTGQPESRIEEWNGRYFQRRIYPVQNAAGEITLLAGFSSEITAQRQAEQEIQAERRLLRELLNLQERERKLISHELHDGFVQDVVGAQMVLGGLTSQMAAIEPDHRTKIKKTQELLQKAIAEARRMIRDLRPVVIHDDSGVVGALQDMVDQEHRQGHLEISFVHDVRFSRLDPMLEGTIFRIVHEALVNVRKHSGTRSVQVRLTQPDDLLLEIADDGQGFDRAHVAPDRFGVRGIIERARLFGGRAEIESSPGSGTRIVVALPIKDAVSSGRPSDAPPPGEPPPPTSPENS